MNTLKPYHYLMNYKPYLKELIKQKKLDYLLAYTHYGLGANMLASYKFKIFTLTYPFSKHNEELAFMAAYCYYLESPKYSLDKTNTLKAIQEVTNFY